MNSRLTQILFFLTLITLSFGQLLRISFDNIPIFSTGSEVMMIIFVATLLVLYKLSPLKNPTKLLKTIFVFLGYLLISLVVSSFNYTLDDNIVAFLYWLRLTLYFFFFIYFLYHISQEGDIKRLRYPVQIFTFIVIITSLVQFFLYQNLGNLAYLGWDPHLYRLVGLYLDPPITVSIFALLIFYFSFNLPNKKAEFPIRLGIIILLFACALLTFSRGGYIALAISIMYFSIKKRMYDQMKSRLFRSPKVVTVLAMTILVMIMALIFVLPKQSEGLNLLRTSSIKARAMDYSKAVTIWKESPFFGIGYNHIRPKKDPYEEQEYFGPYNPSHASASFHSSFLIILVTGGVVGLSILLVLLWQFAALNIFSQTAILYLSIISIFDNVLLHPQVLLLYFILTALTHKKTDIP